MNSHQIWYDGGAEFRRREAKKFQEIFYMVQ